MNPLNTLEGKECIVCYAEGTSMKMPVAIKCDHSYCYPCITEWFKISQSCPTCKSDPYPMKRFKYITYLTPEERKIFESQDDHDNMVFGAIRAAKIGAIVGLVAGHVVGEDAGQIVLRGITGGMFLADYSERRLGLNLLSDELPERPGVLSMEKSIVLFSIICCAVQILMKIKGSPEGPPETPKVTVGMVIGGLAAQIIDKYLPDGWEIKNHRWEKTCSGVFLGAIAELIFKSAPVTFGCVTTCAIAGGVAGYLQGRIWRLLNLK